MTLRGVADLQTIANNEYLTIRPPEGEEWTVLNIYWNEFTSADTKYVEVYKTNGTLMLKFWVDKSGVFGGGLLAQCFKITYDHYIKVKNVTNASLIMGYDGSKNT